MAVITFDKMNCGVPLVTNLAARPSSVEYQPWPNGPALAGHSQLFSVSRWERYSIKA